MTDLVNRLRIKAGMIQMGERIAWGSDSDLMYEAADMIERMMASEEQYTPADMADQGAKQFRAGQAGMYTAEDMCSQAAQGYRDGYAAAKGEACPEGYVMVPVEPTPEWVANLRQVRIDRMESVIEDVLAAAPDVQGEPVSLRQRLFNGWQGCSNHGCVVVDPKPGMMGTNGICQCVVNASRSQLYMLQSRIQSLMATPQPAAQNPAPDVARLVETLEQCITSMLDSGYRANAVVIRAARKALSAYRKGGE